MFERLMNAALCTYINDQDVLEHGADILETSHHNVTFKEAIIAILKDQYGYNWHEDRKAFLRGGSDDEVSLEQLIEDIQAAC